MVKNIIDSSIGFGIDFRHRSQIDVSPALSRVSVSSLSFAIASS
jgi:hypothetical protein